MTVRLRGCLCMCVCMRVHKSLFSRATCERDEKSNGVLLVSAVCLHMGDSV